METKTRKFTITVNEKEYPCYREVEGKRVFYQTVVVEAIGQERDRRRYDFSDVHLMEPHAKSIAAGLVRGANKNKQL